MMTIFWIFVAAAIGSAWTYWYVTYPEQVAATWAAIKQALGKLFRRGEQ